MSQILLTDKEMNKAYNKAWCKVMRETNPSNETQACIEATRNVAQAQLKKVLNAFMILGGDGGNPNNPHPFHYAISRDVYLQWLKECEE